MSSAPVDLLREIPPFQDALAMTGYVPARQVSKDLKIAFDAGACRVWTILKAEANKELQLVAIYMANIEKLNRGEAKVENPLLSFKELNNKLIKGLVYWGPSQLPTTIDSFQFCGPKYVKDAIPEDIQKKAARINHLKKAFASSCTEVPAKFLTFGNIMSIPIVDLSGLMKIWDAMKSGIQWGSDVNFCHVIDDHYFYAKDVTGFERKHNSEKENLRIHAVLQNQILDFLEKQCANHYKEVCIDCDVGWGNTLGFRNANDDWCYTDAFTWTPQGWTGFLPVGIEFKFVKLKSSDCPKFFWELKTDLNVVWEQREGYRTIPKGLKDQFYKIEDVPSFQQEQNGKKT